MATKAHHVAPLARENNVEAGGVTFRDLFAYTPVEYKTCAMVPGGVTPDPGLLVSVYGQSWPNPSFFNSIAGNKRAWSPDHGVRTSKSWVKAQLEKRQARAHQQQLQQQTTSGLLDKNTLKWRSWSGQSASPAGVPGNTLNSAVDCADDTSTDPKLYKLTANEFKKLNGQVTETCSAPGGHNKYRAGQSYRRFCGSAGAKNDDPGSQAYRSQLAGSLRVFQDKQWPPYEHEREQPPHDRLACAARSRPGSSRSDNRLARGTTPTRLSIVHPPQKPRPMSSPALPSRGTHLYVQGLGGTQPNVRDVDCDAEGDVDRALTDSSPFCRFDALTPDIAYELIDGPHPESVYGDRPASALDGLAAVDEAREDEQEEDNPRVANNETDDREEADETSKGKLNSVTDADKDTDLDSDEDNYLEPPMEGLEMRMSHVPDMHLRPEKMDALSVPEYPRGDRRKYDFDADHVDFPPYEFFHPLSQKMRGLPLREYSLGEKNWRELTDIRPENSLEEKIFDRLVELEKLQMKTVEWETQKAVRTRSATKARLASRSRLGLAVTARAQSAKSSWRERKCCQDCLQLACVGDCPAKISPSTTCLICHEKNCAGNCAETVYESRSRQDRPEGDDDRTKLKPKHKPPRNCLTCQTRHTGKYINANYAVLGRPRSGNATFSRGQCSHKPRDLRPKSGLSMSEDLERDLDRLGIEVYQRNGDVDPAAAEGDSPAAVATAPSYRCRSGRASALPGKSYFSQRRNSLTDLTKEPIKINGKTRAKSAKRRARPKTAV